MRRQQFSLKPINHRSQRYRRLVILFCLGWLLVFGLAGSSQAQQLPDLQVYPLPPSLAKVAPGANYGDQLRQTPVGSLRWSQFPITVAIDLADSRAPREAIWLKAVRQAISEWHAYLPLVETDNLERANIIVRRSTVPIRRDQNGKLLRIRAAETRFDFFVDPDQYLRHRMTIYLSPNQADGVLITTARHEMGHALGIWGHSDRPTDVMYFSQVAQTVGITPRDIRTLRQVYQQSTRLGGKLITAEKPARSH
ncbi:matrixin family metalloprotease [filamentous cyanobacterium LEGE 11480]|uniref:Matrixin family metalloprotease n=1 Tax=Romeriopsis navalis LEGE 11480 TaxID=2777977 RepID=A0A928VMY0_9CYAN|nr:matrixin family metalloprotease [Romeriopsis navalis]MBE9028809.1 matrixin family metalloprotease [Romeriopsis navalis LEGE 11480]